MNITLENGKDKDVNFWCFKGEYKGKCTNVYDGDTCHIVFEFNKELVKLRCRLIGYDAPEMKSHIPEQKKIAIEARDKLRELILDKLITCKFHDFDKYGRVLCDIYINDTKHTKHINEFMAKNYGIYGRQEYNNFKEEKGENENNNV